MVGYLKGTVCAILKVLMIYLDNGEKKSRILFVHIVSCLGYIGFPLEREKKLKGKY
jgi:hypothetical protein